MGPVQAIKTGFAKSFQGSGRATRSDFWWFAPFGLALPAGVADFTPPNIADIAPVLTKAVVVAITCIPLTSAASRRYHDTGMHHEEFWRGVGPTVLLVGSAFFLAFGLFAIATIWGLFVGILIAIPSALAFLGFLFVAPASLGTTIGQLLVPSQPGLNPYGPNPFEAPK